MYWMFSHFRREKMLPIYIMSCFTLFDITKIHHVFQMFLFQKRYEWKKDTDNRYIRVHNIVKIHQIQTGIISALMMIDEQIQEIKKENI